MPLHVDIRINERLIEKVHIGRFEGNTHPDTVNTYRATIEGEDYNPEWYGETSVEFHHRYGDGAFVCVEKALQALNEKNNLY